MRLTTVCTVFLLVAPRLGAQGTNGYALLRPSSPDLVTTHFAPRCDSQWFAARDPGSTTEREILPNRLEQRITTHGGKPALLLVSRLSTPTGPRFDSAL